MAADQDAPAATAGPPASVGDPQDPLPESNWKWRRWYVFGSTVLCSIGILIVLLMLYRIAKVDLAGRQGVQTTLSTIEALYGLGWWLILLTLVDRVLYLIAPSAEQATKMIQTVSALKAGVGFASRSTASGPEGTATSSAVAGPASAPPLVPPEPLASSPAQEEPVEELPSYAR
jgi:hypothetical protein